MLQRMASGRIALLFFAIFSLLLLSACGDKNANTDSSAERGDGPKSVAIALGHGLDYLGVNPYEDGRENTVLRTVLFEPLVLETETGVFEGALAESWDVDETGTKWTFHLRKNIKFHDGTDFTSKAVKAAFEHYMADRQLAQRLGIAHITIPDDYTVEFTLKRPFAPFLNVVGSFQCTIPSPTSFDEKGNFVEPIGTGPYKIKSHSKEQVEFVANDDYWRGKPKIDNLTVVYIPDPQTTILALESGEVDLIGADGYGIPYSEIKRLQENKDFKVIENPDSSSLEWVAFNMYKAPLNDKKVRQAINYALDREEITEYVYEGFATPAAGPIGFDDSIPWVDTSIKGYEHDPEKAKLLLAEAGWKEKSPEGYLMKDGQVLEVNFLIQSDRTWKPMGEIIQNQLKEIGIKVNLEMRDNNLIRDLIKKGEFDLAGLGSLGKSTADPYYYFQYYFTTRGLGTVVKGNEKLDSLVSEVVTNINQQERQAIYNGIQRELMEIVPGAFLVHPTKVTIMKKDIEGWEFAGTMDPLRYVYKLSR